MYCDGTLQPAVPIRKCDGVIERSFGGSCNKNPDRPFNQISAHKFHRAAQMRLLLLDTGLGDHIAQRLTYRSKRIFIRPHRRRERATQAAR